MKTFGKVMAGALAAVMLFGSVMTVSAAVEVPSIKAGQNMPTEAVAEDGSAIAVEQYTAASLKAELDASNAVQADADAIMALNAGGATSQAVAAFINALKKSSTAGASELAALLEGGNYKALTGFVNVKGAKGLVTLKVPAVGSYAKEDVLGVHFSTQRSAWEAMETVSLEEDDKATFRFEDGSPFAVFVKVG